MVVSAQSPGQTPLGQTPLGGQHDLTAPYTYNVNINFHIWVGQPITLFFLDVFSTWNNGIKFTNQVNKNPIFFVNVSNTPPWQTATSYKGFNYTPGNTPDMVTSNGYFWVNVNGNGTSSTVAPSYTGVATKIGSGLISSVIQSILTQTGAQQHIIPGLTVSETSQGGANFFIDGSIVWCIPVQWQASTTYSYQQALISNGNIYIMNTPGGATTGTTAPSGTSTAAITDGGATLYFLRPLGSMGLQKSPAHSSMTGYVTEVFKPFKQPTKTFLGYITAASSRIEQAGKVATGYVSETFSRGATALTKSLIHYMPGVFTYTKQAAHSAMTGYVSATSSRIEQAGKVATGYVSETFSRGASAFSQSNLISYITEVLKTTNQPTKTFLGYVSATLGRAEQAQKAFTGYISSAVTRTNTITKSLINYISSILLAAESYIAGSVANTRTFIHYASLAVAVPAKSMAKTIVSYISEVLTEAKQAAQSALTSYVSATSSRIEQAGKSFIGYVSGTLSRTKTVGKSANSYISETFSRGTSAIGKTLSSYVTVIYQAIKQIIHSAIATFITAKAFYTVIDVRTYNSVVTAGLAIQKSFGKLATAFVTTAALSVELRLKSFTAAVTAILAISRQPGRPITTFVTAKAAYSATKAYLRAFINFISINNVPPWQTGTFYHGFQSFNETPDMVTSNGQVWINTGIDGTSSSAPTGSTFFTDGSIAWWVPSQWQPNTGYAYQQAIISNGNIYVMGTVDGGTSGITGPSGQLAAPPGFIDNNMTWYFLRPQGTIVASKQVSHSQMIAAVSAAAKAIKQYMHSITGFISETATTARKINRSVAAFVVANLLAIGTLVRLLSATITAVVKRQQAILHTTATFITAIVLSTYEKAQLLTYNFAVAIKLAAPVKTIVTIRTAAVSMSLLKIGQISKNVIAKVQYIYTTTRQINQHSIISFINAVTAFPARQFIRAYGFATAAITLRQNTANKISMALVGLSSSYSRLISVIKTYNPVATAIATPITAYHFTIQFFAWVGQPNPVSLFFADMFSTWNIGGGINILKQPNKSIQTYMGMHQTRAPRYISKIQNFLINIGTVGSNITSAIGEYILSETGTNQHITPGAIVSESSKPSLGGAFIQKIVYKSLNNTVLTPLWAAAGYIWYHTYTAGVNAAFLIKKMFNLVRNNPVPVLESIGKSIIPHSGVVQTFFMNIIVLVPRETYRLVGIFARFSVLYSYINARAPNFINFINIKALTGIRNIAKLELSNILLIAFNTTSATGHRIAAIFTIWVGQPNPVTLFFADMFTTWNIGGGIQISKQLTKNLTSLIPTANITQKLFSKTWNSFVKIILKPIGAHGVANFLAINFHIWVGQPVTLFFIDIFSTWNNGINVLKQVNKVTNSTVTGNLLSTVYAGARNIARNFAATATSLVPSQLSSKILNFPAAIGFTYSYARYGVEQLVNAVVNIGLPGVIETLWPAGIFLTWVLGGGGGASIQKNVIKPLYNNITTILTATEVPIGVQIIKSVNAFVNTTSFIQKFLIKGVIYFYMLSVGYIKKTTTKAFTSNIRLINFSQASINLFFKTVTGYINAVTTVKNALQKAVLAFINVVSSRPNYLTKAFNFLVSIGTQETSLWPVGMFLTWISGGPNALGGTFIQKTVNKNPSFTVRAIITRLRQVTVKRIAAVIAYGFAILPSHNKFATALTGASASINMLSRPLKQLLSVVNIGLLQSSPGINLIFTTWWINPGGASIQIMVKLNRSFKIAYSIIIPKLIIKAVGLVAVKFQNTVDIPIRHAFAIGYVTATATFTKGFKLLTRIFTVYFGQFTVGGGLLGLLLSSGGAPPGGAFIHKTAFKNLAHFNEIIHATRQDVIKFANLFFMTAILSQVTAIKSLTTTLVNLISYMSMNLTRQLTANKIATNIVNIIAKLDRRSILRTLLYSLRLVTSIVKAWPERSSYFLRARALVPLRLLGKQATGFINIILSSSAIIKPILGASSTSFIGATSLLANLPGKLTVSRIPILLSYQKALIKRLFFTLFTSVIRSTIKYVRTVITIPMRFSVTVQSAITRTIIAMMKELVTIDKAALRIRTAVVRIIVRRQELMAKSFVFIIKTMAQIKLPSSSYFRIAIASINLVVFWRFFKTSTFKAFIQMNFLLGSNALARIFVFHIKAVMQKRLADITKFIIFAAVHLMELIKAIAASRTKPIFYVTVTASFIWGYVYPLVLIFTMAFRVRIHWFVYICRTGIRAGNAYLGKLIEGVNAGYATTTKTIRSYLNKITKIGGNWD